MSYILTLVSSSFETRPITMSHVRDVMELLRQQGHMITCAPVMIEQGRAADIGVMNALQQAQISKIRLTLSLDRVDVFCSPIEGRRKKLLLADMDSTIIKGESLDDLAEHMNLKAEISDITERAMNGELDFQTALRARVQLLKGLEVSAMTGTARAMKLNPGAQELVTTMRVNGATCVLVTGGFTFFADMIATKVGFHKYHGNTLGIEQQVLTGEVREPILDKSAKLRFLYEYAQGLRIKPDAAMTIGDGANDLPMLEAAGFGVAYYPKPVVAKQILNQVVYGDLTAPLFAQGYTYSRIQDAMAMTGQ